MSSPISAPAAGSTPWSTGSGAISCSSPDRVGREGGLRLAFERRGPRTVLTGCRFTLPLQALGQVSVDEADLAVVSVLNPTGGLVGGDRLRLEVALGAGGHACLTTPSATRIYRTLGAPAVQEISIDVGPGAVIEYVPEHTIPFAGSAFVQTIEVALGPEARAIVIDAYAAGRVARGEAWSFARLDASLTVHDAAGLIVRDRFCLESPHESARCGMTDGAPYFGTVLVLGSGASLDPDRLPAGDGSHAEGLAIGASALRRGGTIVRILAGRAPVLIDALERVWAEARRQMLGRAPLALRKL